MRTAEHLAIVLERHTEPRKRSTSQGIMTLLVGFVVDEPNIFSQMTPIKSLFWQRCHKMQCLCLHIMSGIHREDRHHPLTSRERMQKEV